jgi:hypothetical protein
LEVGLEEVVPHLIEVTTPAPLGKRIEVCASLQIPFLHQGIDAWLGHLPPCNVLCENLIGVIEIDKSQLRSGFFTDSKCD